MSNAIEKLFVSLSRRERPEDVAELIRLEFGNELSREELSILNHAASGAHSRGGWGYSSLSQEFARPVGLAKQIAVAQNLFPTIEVPSADLFDKPEPVSAYIAATSQIIAKVPGKSDFKSDRLDRARRADAGLGELSKRQYNKRFRLLLRMERKVTTLEREIRKREYTLLSKSRLAYRLTSAEFSRDRNTACFVAYLTARANLRSVFTNQSQDRPYDEIADMLFSRCRKGSNTNWWAIAHVHPDVDVLARLSDEQKGRFLGIWLGMLTDIAGMLREIWENSRFDRATMIVKRGDDSTTWNATAGAWNKVRESWINVLHALGMEEILDRVCPGKVLRLMAADVAMWHRMSGGGLEPDTAVWAALPPPWEVLSGDSPCSRALVEDVCRRSKVDPVKKGWISPRPERVVAVFRPTPELVHGVEVGHPGVAKLLRSIGVFSGKSLKLPT